MAQDSSNKPDWLSRATIITQTATPTPLSIPANAESKKDQPVSVSRTPDSPSPDWLTRARPVATTPTAADRQPEWLSRAVPVGGVASVAEGDTPEYKKLREEADSLTGGITDANIIGSKAITPAEINTIAEKYKVAPETLRNWMPFLGAETEWKDVRLSDIPKAALGQLGLSIGLGLPQKAAKQFVDPNMEKALDDLQELAARRSSLLTTGAQIGMPGGAISAGTKATRGARIAAGSATGALAGFGGSRAGEELPGIAIGTVLGGGVGAIQHKLATRAGREVDVVPNKVPDLVPEYKTVQRGGADLEKEIIESVERLADVDEMVANIITTPGKSASPWEAAVIAEAMDPEAFQRAVAAGKESDIVALGNRILEREAANLASDVGVSEPGNAIAVVQKWAGVSGPASGQGAEYARNRIMRQLQNKRINDVLDAAGVHTAERANVVNRAIDYLSDAQYVLRAMDEKLPGIGIESAHKEINWGLNRLSYPREEMRRAIGDIFLGNRKAGVDKVALDGSAIIEKLQAGEALTGKEKQAYSGFREFFRQGLDGIAKLAEKDNLPPLNIKERPNYIPSQLMDYDKLDTVVQHRIGKLLNDASQLTGIKYTDLAQLPEDVYTAVIRGSDAHRSTIQFLRMIGSEGGARPSDISLAYKKAFVNPETREKLETVARAALEREDLIPLWARETNLYKLADKWTTNTLRHLYLRQGIEKLNNAADIISKRGMGREAEYLKNLVADMNGIRKGTVAAYTTKGQANFYRWVDKKILEASSNAAKDTWETVRAFPAILQAVGRNVHANLLGANPRTLMMNLTQTFTKTLPEFGTPYGSSLFFRGAMSAARGQGLRGVAASAKRLEQLGLQPAKYVGGSLPYLAEGAFRGSVPQALGKLATKSSEVIMLPFAAAETLNRVIALRASEAFVDDLAKGSKLAGKALSGMPTSVQRGIASAFAADDIEGALRIAATHIINSTQYQYNRASMSQYGRTMGPLFSTFSKWPTATLGQLAENYRTHGVGKGTLRNLDQLVLPWMLLEAADQVYLRAQDEEELSDREAKLMSKQGLSQAAPIGNIKGILTGDFFTPPAVDTAMKVFVQPFQRGDVEDAPDKIVRALGEGLYQFAPGAAGGWIRFLTDDAVTFAMGERPEGTGFLERTQSGLEQIGD